MEELARGLWGWLRCRLRAVALATGLVIAIALAVEAVRALSGLG